MIRRALAPDGVSMRASPDHQKASSVKFSGTDGCAPGSGSGSAVGHSKSFGSRHSSSRTGSSVRPSRSRPLSLNHIGYAYLWSVGPTRCARLSSAAAAGAVSASDVSPAIEMAPATTPTATRSRRVTERPGSRSLCWCD